ncbi:MAG TPA: glutamate--tRNA ligase [Dehalococcoidia bacterium]|nr:glutamate--tRNA ligase [Dehalococcoidia bacterium]
MAENDKVRVRYAPSPTGYPHVGNIRTALFNWLFARHHGGKFILRIEDTDLARKVEGALEVILESLRWLGMDWDEGPCFQSQRLSLYSDAAEKLVASGQAYYCYCSAERLDAMRREQMQQKKPTGYDRRCRNLALQEKIELEDQGITPVVRFKSPLQGQTSFHDLIRGDIVFENSTLDDFVLLKSDGYPTYHLANIVDDHDMHISHVLRAEEWVSSTPRHVLLYAALGWQPPLFAHLPMILGADRSKLSKRHGATAINEYLEQGFLRETMVNFLALLGWSLDDKTEVMTADEIIKNFSLERISKTAAIFNREKLEWMNGVYIRNLAPDDFRGRVTPFLEADLPQNIARPLDNVYIGRILPLVQERAKTLKEVSLLIDFLFYDGLEYDKDLLLGKLQPVQGLEAINRAIAGLQGLGEWSTQVMENAMRPLCAELNLKPAVFFGLLRVAITGRTISPPLFQTMEVLGRERCLTRLEAALDKLKN